MNLFISKHSQLNAYQPNQELNIESITIREKRGNIIKAALCNKRNSTIANAQKREKALHITKEQLRYIQDQINKIRNF